MTIIFAGTIGRSGLGGQAWAGLQYLLGFRALGHEVYYLEDCGRSSWVYQWEKEDWTHELTYPAAYVQACLEPFGLGDRWIYRDSSGFLGLPPDQFRDVCAHADLLLLRAPPFWVWRLEYDLPKRRAFIDIDPGYTQMSIANGDAALAQGIGRFEKRFTCGHRVGQPGSAIPLDGGPWLPTVPPVYLPEWAMAQSEATHFTSVVRWQGFKEVVFDGVAYGQRDREFARFLELPRQTSQRFRLAQVGMKPEVLEDHGWEAVAGEVFSRTPALYHRFVQNSRAEFSVPKHGYATMRGGWFSDRSVCYLASGRPVLIEDTGLHDWLPCGDGLVTFTDLDSALAGIDRINSNYQQHQQAARQLAEMTFSTEVVLPRLLQEALS